MGKGKYTYARGAAAGGEGDEDVQNLYEGQWKNNEKHGIGKQTYVGSGEYFGYWENGKRQGEGVFTYLSKDVYSG